MKIAYIARYDVTRPETWSRNETGLASAGGTIYNGLAQRGHDMIPVGPLERIGKPVAALKRRLILATSGQTYHFWAEAKQLNSYAQQAEIQLNRQLGNQNADIILTTENLIPIAKLNRPEPLVAWLDSSLAGLIDYYPYMTNLCPQTHRQVLALEREAFSKTDLLLFTSEWAASVAQKTYSIPDKKIRVLPFSAQIECNWGTQKVRNFIKNRPIDVCRLVLVGVHWERKGAPLAIAVAEELNKQGLKTELTVVGSTPPEGKALPPFVTLIPFLDKNSTEDSVTLRDLLFSSHFFILPTQAECLAVVLLEAMAHGLPCLTSSEGGVPILVKSGVTGENYLLSEGITPYVRAIQYYMANRQEYELLAESSFRHFDENLRWESVLQKAEEHFYDLFPQSVTMSA